MRYLKKEEKSKRKFFDKKIEKLNERERELIDFSTLRRLKNEEEVIEGDTYLGIDFKTLKTPFLLKSILKDNRQPGQEVSLETKGEGVRKSYRSFQAFFFLMALSLFSCFAGVMFIGWIHINLDADTSDTGVAAIDDASIWVRSVAIFVALLVVAVKAVRGHHKRRKYTEFNY